MCGPSESGWAGDLSRDDFVSPAGFRMLLDGCITSGQCKRLETASLVLPGEDSQQTLMVIHCVVGQVAIK